MIDVVVVRRGMPADLDAVRGLQAQLAPHWTPADRLPAATPLEHKVWADMLADPRRLILVAELNGIAEPDVAVFGIVDVVLVHSLLDGVAPHAILDSLVVDHTRRGAGIGRSLVSQARSLAVQHGCCRLELLSSKERTDAHAFYQALGLQPVAEGFRQNLAPPASTALR